MLGSHLSGRTTGSKGAMQEHNSTGRRAGAGRAKKLGSMLPSS